MPLPLEPAVLPRTPRWLSWALAFAAGAYLLSTLDHGWYPHDEGMLGQVAERVLAGELPHKDFADVYTGGLSFLHALAFRLLGTTAMSLRYVLLLAYGLWVPVVFAVARRIAPLWPAAAITVLAAVMTVPLYPASMPSWYNLFLVTVVAAALLRAEEAGGTRWYLLAGMACGASILVKLTGLFHLAGALVACLLLQQEARPARCSGDPVGIFEAAISLGVLLVGAAAALLTSRSSIAAHLWLLGLPIVLVCAAAAHREWTRAPRALTEHWTAWGASVFAIGTGASVPIALFAIPFVMHDGVGDLLRGVFSTPQGRLQFAATGPDVYWLFVGAMAITGLAVAWTQRQLAEKRLAVPVVVAMLLLIGSSRVLVDSYRLLWYALWISGPLSIVAAAWRIGRPSRAAARPSHAAPPTSLLVIVPLLAFAALVQFPYMSPTYFAYIVPFVLLVIAALGSQWRDLRGPLAQVLAFGILVFATWNLRGHGTSGLGYAYDPLDEEKLDLPRAHLWVSKSDVATYTKLNAGILRHAHTRYLWAGPDSPEVYFLSGKLNATRVLYDFFEPLDERHAAPLRVLRSGMIDAAVLRQDPKFSAPLAGAVADSFAARLPMSARIGDFVLRWAR